MTLHNLPYQSTPFVGRSAEIADIIDRLSNPDCHLLTLMGPGGIGKTRLAVEVGSKQFVDFADDIFFVPLQSLSSPEHITLAIAQTLQYQLTSTGEPVDELFRYLADKRIFLILDNFDHLLAGAAMISDLLSNAPSVKILVTSRERLNLLEEWVFEVGGLKRDDPKSKEVDAVQLFVQTAKRARPSFSLVDEYQFVIRICHLVEGMPLAIELAASWVQRLPLQAILNEIEAGLNIFESRTLNMSERHRSMRVTFDHSWRLLRDVEKNTFKKLSVFRGGFWLEAAQEVTGATRWELATLVDKSLLRIDDSGRYDLHELIRQYGEGVLDASTEERELINDLHCQYYLRFLAQRAGYLRGKVSRQAFKEVEQEIDNIRVAWEWVILQVRVHHEIMNAALDAIWYFYDIRCWNQEAESLFRRTADVLDVEGISQEKPLVTARVLTRLSIFVWNSGRFDEAKHLLETSLEICRRGEALEEVAFCLLRLAEVNYMANTLVEGQSYLEESLSIFTNIGDAYGRAKALGYLGFWYHSYRKPGRARQLLEESVALFQMLDDSTSSVMTYYHLAVALIEEGENVLAQHFAEESLRLSEGFGFKHGMALSLSSLAEILCRRGQTAPGLEYAHQALHLSLELRRMHLIVSALIACAHILVMHGKHKEALELFSLTRHHPATLRDGLISIDRGLGELKKRLPADQYVAVLDRSQNLDLESTAHDLLQDWDRRMKRRADKPIADALTRRELDVLQRVAAGLTNPQIADELVFTVGTVKWYLHQIYTKLDVNNRTEAVVCARELNLLS